MPYISFDFNEDPEARPEECLTSTTTTTNDAYPYGYLGPALWAPPNHNGAVKYMEVLAKRIRNLGNFHGSIERPYDTPVEGGFEYRCIVEFTPENYNAQLSLPDWVCTTTDSLPRIGARMSSIGSTEVYPASECGKAVATSDTGESEQVRDRLTSITLTFKKVAGHVTTEKRRWEEIIRLGRLNPDFELFEVRRVSVPEGLSVVQECSIHCTLDTSISQVRSVEDNREVCCASALLRRYGPEAGGVTSAPDEGFDFTRPFYLNVVKAGIAPDHDNAYSRYAEREQVQYPTDYIRQRFVEVGLSSDDTVWWWVSRNKPAGVQG